MNHCRVRLPTSGTTAADAKATIIATPADTILPACWTPLTVLYVVLLVAAAMAPFGCVAFKTLVVVPLLSPEVMPAS